MKRAQPSLVSQPSTGPPRSYAVCVTPGWEVRLCPAVRRPNSNRDREGPRYMWEKLLKRLLLKFGTPKAQQALAGGQLSPNPASASRCSRATHSAEFGDHLGICLIKVTGPEDHRY